MSDATIKHDTRFDAPRNRDAAGFGIYIHWPFCAQKCPYCDFNSHVRHKGWDEQRFRAAYLAELSDARTRTGPRTVSSIFFGGGTPSLMQPETTEAIIDRIATLWHLPANTEITLEANPGSVDATRFKGYRATGVNRVSMGFQSFDDDALKRLGRIHSVAESLAALDTAQRAFDRVSFDLIYARPDQSPEAWKQELETALAFGTSHLSLYQLTIEPDTPYAALHAAGKLIVPDEDAALDLYAITQELTERAGLATYEISNHARPGEESRHNLLYWRYGEYAGIGPGAHGRLIVDDVRRASITERHPETWCERVETQGHGWISDEALSPAEQCDEALLMGLRLRAGLSLGRLETLGGLAPAQDTIDGLTRLGLIETINDNNKPLETTSPITHIRATPRGRFVLDAVVRELSRSLRPVASPIRTGHMSSATPPSPTLI